MRRPSPEAGGARFGRRAALVAALAVGAFAPSRAFANPGFRVGGRLGLTLPWPVRALDPHALDDVLAALVGEVVFDRLYTLDEAGKPVPHLAAALPEVTGAGARIALRTGLRSASGRPLTARDVVFSLERARLRGARGWLAPFGAPKADGAGAVRLPTKEAEKLALALASPLVAIVPSTFAPAKPEATGSLAATFTAQGLTLARNPHALVPSYLDELALRPAADLASSLRSFETGADDVGWLGAGLHEPRAGARSFDGGVLAWALLRLGRDAGVWGAPGVAQRLCDGLAPERLSYLGLGTWPQQPEEGWGGPPGDVLVRADSPWLVELAKAVAGTLSRPQHELTAKPIPAEELQSRRASRAYALAVDVARPLDPTLFGALVSLATADDPVTAEDVARHPPRLGALPVRALTRTRRVGLLGEVRVQGAHGEDAVLPASARGVDWAGAFRPRP